MNDRRARFAAGLMMAIGTEMSTSGAAAASSPETGNNGAPSGAAPPPLSRRELAGPWSFRRVAGPAAAAGAGGAGGVAGAPPPATAAEPWLPAKVPGCVHTDLFANAKIGDPFYRLNEKDQQWIEREGWEYRTSFSVDAATLHRDRVELTFLGLDTYAEVFLNGVSILWATNMFRTFHVDVKAQLRAGDNELVVRFRSPIRHVKPVYDHLGYTLPAANDQAAEMVSMFSRKAPYHYGWDWGPRFVTSGIWRPVTLEAWDEARLDDVHVVQDRLDDGEARLTVKARVRAARAGRATVTVGLEEAGGGAPLGTAEADLRAGDNEIAVPVRIAKPERWWPRGLGLQRLYALETRLAGGGGALRDMRRTRVGLRTLEVVHAPDAEGKSFFVKVNGAPVFMKGANWIPADSFVPRMTEERYRHLLQSAADVNMNMLRVWGGGIYEDDRFYDLCDELGILVWQDFMFACSMYPGDGAFLESVRHEAQDNVRRLRNHPSLALWAGNNEIEAAWQGWAWPEKFHLSRAAQDRIGGDYKKLFHEILPAVVAAEDPGRFYTRSSPSANDDAVPANKLGWGDMHYWGVWHAEEPYTKYADNVSRFMSEYGFQSFPELGSVARYTARQTDWDITSPVMLSHQRHPRGNALIGIYLDRDFRHPKDFASFLYVQQVLQATVIKYAAEAHRRQMGHNWGSLYWQLDDCWPVASWSGIDYYGRWKALHYAARQFFAPVLVSPVDAAAAGKGKGKDQVEIWGISDRRADTRARLAVRVLDVVSGREVWRREQQLTLAANASRVYLSLSRREALRGTDPARAVLVAELSEGGKRLSRNLLAFAKTKDMALPAPDLRTDVEPREDGSLAVKVSARRFARAVYLTAGIDGFFEDNYFDLLPGEIVTVGFRPAAPATTDALRSSLHAMTIADSY